MAAVALAVVTVGWFEAVPELTATEAVEVTEGAFRAAGLEGEVVSPALARTYEPRGRDVEIEVWETNTAIPDGTVQLFLARDDAAPVWIEDLTPNGTRQMLSDAQLDALVDAADHPAAAERLRRNVALTVAAAAILALAIALAFLPDRKQRS